jgi:stromal membrane-associated protein
MDYQGRLSKILTKPGNLSCADCDSKNPRWASISLGVFVCIRCCGVHRGLGTHISKMKSTTLDKWTGEMLIIFERIDNIVANKYWEARLPSTYSKPVEGSSSSVVESFIREKYDRKLWRNEGPSPACNTFNPQGAAAVKTNTLLSVTQPNYKALSKPQTFTTDLLSDPIFEVKKPSSSQCISDIDIFSSIPIAKPIINIPAQAPEFVSFTPLSFTALPELNSSLIPSTKHDNEKNDKINQVLSMYSKVQNSVPVQNPTSQNTAKFQPLGALAAQNFFKMSGNSLIL